jgi:hypothetical protein
MLELHKGVTFTSPRQQTGLIRDIRSARVVRVPFGLWNTDNAEMADLRGALTHLEKNQS